MTNKEKWLAYTDNLSSPQNYIEWSFRFMIGAALERRVWFGYDNMKLFPCTYTILTGEAGLGKGIIINPTLELLKYHKRKDFKQESTANEDSTSRFVREETDKNNMEIAKEAEYQAPKGSVKADLPLFSFAPDATSYEKLVLHMAKSIRYINYPYANGDGKQSLGVYGHCSMYFGLPELSSLFRKRTEDTVNLLLGLYDCPEDYIYSTITRKEDRIRRGCLNMLAGTTPDFLQTVFDQRLIDQGFSSRAFFIYASKNRKNVFAPVPLTAEQQQYRLDILTHLKKLAGLYGQATVTKETWDWLHEWWDKEETERFNASKSRLNPFRARLNIHTIKVAMQEHFAQSTDFLIPRERFEDAIKAVKGEMDNMATALSFAGDNPLSRLTHKVEKYLERNVKEGVSIVDLLTEFWEALPNGKSSMEEVLAHLIGTGKVKDKEEQTNNGKVILKYRINV